jgi:2-polyprenyl-3-methyl-5-hydroxy-6-metoxy-1,4-benzoquinol methylase
MRRCAVADVTPVTRCGICGSDDLALILEMGDQPLAEAMGTTRRYPLALAQCGNCSLVQLSHIVDKRLVFPAAHPYATGNTVALREHFLKLAVSLMSPLRTGDLVADIGANDGTLLSMLAGHGLRLVAVEPTGQARKCAEKGIVTYQEFFTDSLAEKIRRDCGQAKRITACNVLAHVPDAHDFMEGVRVLLDDDGLFVTENHDWASIERGLQYDAVYHEHLRYYSVRSLSYLLGMHGFEVVASVPVSTHGGSFRVTARMAVSEFLDARARQAADNLAVMLRAVARDAPVYGIGAATRATPLIHYARISEFVTCVCEVAGSEKIGQNMPGTLIPVVDEAKLTADQPPFALLFAWHIADTLIPKLRSAGYRGGIIVPLPEPRVVAGG